MCASPRARATGDRPRLRSYNLLVAELTSQPRSRPPRPQACPTPSRLPPSAMPDPDICLASTGEIYRFARDTANWRRAHQLSIGAIEPANLLVYPIGGTLA